jgi:hypothetical protein
LLNAAKPTAIKARQSIAYFIVQFLIVTKLGNSAIQKK